MDHQDLLDQAMQRIALAPKPIQAIEAFWDGDTGGWFVVMVALMAREGPDETQASPPYRLADLCYPCALKAEFGA